MSLSKVCEHGSLKRQCLPCELQEQLKAADDLAKVIYVESVRTGTMEPNIQVALAAYVKERGI